MVFRHVAVGGTFDRIHLGHEKLLEKAVSSGDFVSIGIISDSIVEDDVEPFESRRKSVEAFLTGLRPEGFTIIELEDSYGPAVFDETMDALVVSDETFEKALELNKIRRQNGLKELNIIKIPMEYADDGAILSSSRIRNGEIDRRGRII
jgi:pantetheine-phosphate adenylyltransferase